MITEAQREQLEAITPENYDLFPAVNWSSLKYIDTSPYLYQWRKKHPAPRKASFAFGGAAHCAVLEPELFEKRYAVYDGARNKKHAAYREWLEAHPGVEAILPGDMWRARQLAKAVYDNRDARELLKGGRREEPRTWIDPVTGLVCKGRFDYIRPDFLLELKSAHDPTPKRFERDALSFGYAGQTAFYHDGATTLRLIDGRVRPFIIAAQSVEPFHVVVFQLTAETLEHGRALHRSLQRRLIECTEADYWPGIAPGVQQLGLPPWVEGMKLEQETDEEDF